MLSLKYDKNRINVNNLFKLKLVKYYAIWQKYSHILLTRFKGYAILLYQATKTALIKHSTLNKWF